MNEYDSNRILDFAKKINYTQTKTLKETDCYVLNTCHIRAKSTDKVYHEIGRVKKEFRTKKKPTVIITGCVAQAEGEILLKKENYIDAVVGPQSYHEINEVILKNEKKNKKTEKIDHSGKSVDDQIQDLLMQDMDNLPMDSGQLQEMFKHAV